MLWSLGAFSLLCIVAAIPLRNTSVGMLGSVVVGELGTLAGAYAGYQIAQMPPLRLLAMALIAIAIINPGLIYMRSRLAVLGITLQALLLVAAYKQF